MFSLDATADSARMIPLLWVGSEKGLLHGLLHTYASMLASSGKVDMYVLQKLLTHKSPKTTQRNAHFRDATLKDAADLAGELIQNAVREKRKVVNMYDK